MVPDSKVLILTLTSKTQVTEDATGEYLRDNSMASRLEEERGKKLMQARNDIWYWMRQAGEKWCGATIAELADRDALREGEDFDGHEPGALYLPAVERYRGRFYTALGSKGRGLLRQPEHHVLLLSHVYGLVWPTESIQLHSCPIRDELGGRIETVDNIWRHSDYLLTSLLTHYIERHGIRLLFDLTADPDFRDLVRWRKLSERKDLDIRRGWGTRSAGADSLSAFGHLTRELLSMPDHELLSIPPRCSWDAACEEVLLLPLAEEPPAHILRPQQDTRDLRDHIRRARDGVVRLVNQLDHSPLTWDDDDLRARIQAIEERGDMTQDEAERMGDLLDLRNHVDHDGYRDRDLDAAASDFQDDCKCLFDLAGRKHFGEIDELRPGRGSE